MRTIPCCLVVLLLLSACTTATESVPPAIPSSSPSAQESAPFMTSPQPSPSPMTSPQPYPRLSASPSEIEHLPQIQTALAERLLHTLPAEKVLCEWEILGRDDLEIYVWARCSGLVEIGQNNPGHPTAEIPAVIHVAEDGAVESVEIPGIGNQYASSIRALFPVDVQTIIFDDLIDYARLRQHLNWRLDHPDQPPLIVLDSTLE